MSPETATEAAFELPQEIADCFARLFIEHARQLQEAERASSAPQDGQEGPENETDPPQDERRNPKAAQ